jgi:hypothetical protein
MSYGAAQDAVALYMLHVSRPGAPNTPHQHQSNVSYAVFRGRRTAGVPRAVRLPMYVVDALMVIAPSVKKICIQSIMKERRRRRCRGVRVVVVGAYIESALRLGGRSVRQTVGLQPVRIVVLCGRQVVSVELGTGFAKYKSLQHVLYLPGLRSWLNTYTRQMA